MLMSLNMILKKEINVFLKDDAKKAYLLLKTKNDKDSITLLNSIERAINILSSNPQYGNPISKKQFPASLIDKYIINNLYRVGLSKYWRLLYTKLVLKFGISYLKSFLILHYIYIYFHRTY